MPDIPDVVLGALIAGIFTGIGFLISYRTTRLQIQARRDELNQQLNYQEKEAQRNRLIEARKDILLRLRQTISEWVEFSHRQVSMDVRLKEAFKNGKTDIKRKLETKAYLDISDKMQQVSAQFEILRGQLIDNTLDTLIEAVKETHKEVDLARMPLIRFFNNPKDADIDALESAIEEEEALRKKVWKQNVKVNKRIEELLSGEPSD